VPRLVVVGGGIMGTMHAVAAIDRGWDVLQLDMDAEPQEASARTIGMVWITGRAPGIELEVALDARTRWEELARRVPSVGFRPDGSVTVATHPAHLAVMEQVLDRDDADLRGLRLLTEDEVRAVNPAVRGAILGALHGSRDAVIEPRAALGALRDHLLATGSYAFLGGRQVWEVDRGRIVDTQGQVHAGDAVVICAGARSSVLGSMVSAGAPLRRVRKQVVQTAPYGVRLPTALADADSLRRVDGFAVPARELLPPAPPVVEEFGVQLLCVQRRSGALTIGDTHEREEPFPFDLSERPSQYLQARLGELLGGEAPPVVRRWEGVYHRCSDDRIWYREEIDDGVVVVTGAGGHGLTLSPAIAEDTLTWLEGGTTSGAALPSAERPPAGDDDR
jgi:FAD dependent oxidoreductase TIGR03364